MSTLSQSELIVSVRVSDSDEFVVIWEQNERLVEHNVIILTTFNSLCNTKYMWNSQVIEKQWALGCNSVSQIAQLSKIVPFPPIFSMTTR